MSHDTHEHKLMAAGTSRNHVAISVVRHCANGDNEQESVKTKNRRYGLVYYLLGGLLIFGCVVGGNLISNAYTPHNSDVNRRILMQEPDAARIAELDAQTDFASQIPLPAEDDIRLNVEEDDGERQALLPQQIGEEGEDEDFVDAVCVVAIGCSVMKVIFTFLLLVASLISWALIHYETNAAIGGSFKDSCMEALCDSGGLREQLKVAYPADTAQAILEDLKNAKMHNDVKYMKDVEHRVKEACYHRCEFEAYKMTYIDTFRRHTKYAYDDQPKTLDR